MVTAAHCCLTRSPTFDDERPAALARGHSAIYRSYMLEPGSPAPDFALPDDAGDIRRLSEFVGRTVVLWFYPKADTPG